MSDDRDPKVAAFLEEVIAVCQRHGMSIAHEDGHGAFEVTDYDESFSEWLRWARDERKTKSSTVNIIAWTDYPFTVLGDAPNKPAPIRQVIVTAYDGDKYAYVWVGAHRESVKRGYLYTEPGRLHQSPPLVSEDTLSKLPKYPNC